MTSSLFRSFHDKHKIAILVRDDFYEKQGGDTIQIKSYVELSTGYDYQILRFKELLLCDHGTYKLFVLTNIDNLSSYVRFYNLLSSWGRENSVVILPIHHSLVFSTAIPGILRLIFDLYSFHILREKLKLFFSCLLHFNLFSTFCFALLFCNYKIIISRSLVRSRLVICISEAEKRTIISDFGIPEADLKSCIIRNGCSAVNFRSELSPFPLVDVLERDIDVLVVGRIERRKNQINIIRHLQDSGLSVVFVGSRNPNNPLYCSAFMWLARSFKNIYYLGSVPNSSMHLFYRRAKVHLSASHFEVSSLVDIEAFNYNCFVISSACGYSYEILQPPGFMLAHPSALADTAKKIMQVIKTGQFSSHYSRRVPYTVTWADSAANFHKSIVRVLSNPIN